MYKKNTIHYAVLELYIRKITTTLPKISDGEEFGTSELFDAYVTSVDNALDYCLNEETLSEDLSGLVSEKLDFIKSGAKAVLVRNWMRKNNYLVEMLDMFTVGKDGDVVEDYLGDHAEHTQTLVGVVLKYLKSMEAIKRKSDVAVEKLDEDDEDKDDGNDESNDDDNTSDDNVPDDDATDDESDDISDEAEDDDGNEDDPDDVGSDEATDSEMDDLTKL